MLNRLVTSGADCVGEVEAGRWEALLTQDMPAACRFIAGIQAVHLFDAGAFGVSPAEASAMDPQQRLLLEAAQQSLKLTPPGANSGAPETSVFVALSNSDFLSLMHTEFSSRSSVYMATGGAISVAAGRISFTFDLQGPCLTIDTACSSALVALDSAMSTHTGFFHSLVAAASIYLVSFVSLAYANAGMLATDGRCKTFDSRASGYVRGEGVGALIVQHGAESAGAVVMSTKVMCDGRSACLTAPNGSVQQRLVERAKEQVRVSVAPSLCRLLDQLPPYSSAASAGFRGFRVPQGSVFRTVPRGCRAVPHGLTRFRAVLRGSADLDFR